MQKMFGILLREKFWKTTNNGIWKAIPFHFKLFSKNLDSKVSKHMILVNFIFILRKS